ncbi:NHL domain-containing protein [Streptomyces sp. IBSNAI002]|uniref:NHL domain-containing protein n=1 Tax=Streptomyces sp. IBSNAI002 TaxID=3457500 RepID=UPI003FCF8CBD
MQVQVQVWRGAPGDAVTPAAAEGDTRVWRQARAAAEVSSPINRFAGCGASGFSGDRGPAALARLSSPHGIAAAPDGSVVFADLLNNRVRKVDAEGTVTTVVGDGRWGDTGDGGPATEARLKYPYGVALAPDGALLVADTNNHRVRRVGPDGTITTIAGDGLAGYGGDGGPATGARLNHVTHIAAAPDGSVFLADTFNHRIRRIDPAGTITTVAGTGSRGSTGDYGPAAWAALNCPYGLAPAPDGTLLFADTNNHRIRRIGRDGTVTTVAGNGLPGDTGDGGPAVRARLNSPRDVAVAPDGSLVIADSFNDRLRKVDPAGVITTVAGAGRFGTGGDGESALRAELGEPRAVALRPDGSVVVADYFHDRLRLVHGVVRPSVRPPAASLG